MTALTLKELIADRSPPSAVTFSSEVSKASMVMYSDKVNYTQQDIQDTVKLLIGNTKYGLAGGKIQRDLPIAHPQFPWLYVDGIPRIDGVGQMEQINAVVPSLVPNPVQPAQYALYKQLVWHIEFSQLPYTPLPDSSIDMVSNATPNFAALAQFYTPAGGSSTFYYADEWKRYTKFSLAPVDKSVTATLGQMTFRGGSANGVVFPGQLKKFLPDQILTVKWYKVPYRYIISPRSYLNKYKGYINQINNARGNTFGTYTGGQLLYVGYKPSEPYTMPYPTVEWIFGVNQYAKYGDIELNFLCTNRTSTSPPTPSNLNYLTSGWNAQPWFKDQKYYYVATRTTPGTDATSDTPPYLSVPFEILFTDPDQGNANI